VFRIDGLVAGEGGALTEGPGRERLREHEPALLLGQGLELWQLAEINSCWEIHWVGSW
jgi:hypothetical protein